MQKAGVGVVVFLVLLVLSINTSLSRQQPTINNAYTLAFTVVADSVDKQTGLIMAPGYTLVKQNCVRCHSPKLITDKRATRDGWLATIRWMQQTQGLWDLGKAEPEILDYLAKNYAPTNEGRRPPLKSIEWYKL
ncbi:hypothetical protein [Adhaeribacter rhizoryzae]|uniref:Monoheme cytochrome C n=1 Tax=Adhaeribacter rhizoryzae TaxID=2607907 RepID=A0A5M6D0J1_9BACT|nr:hypothetical protein [Adhaeribacter rhizoryzae]KAA5539812.1 hypothetical protein F0145_23795 [Adhaeribacter rhizoryzae]